MVISARVLGLVLVFLLGSASAVASGGGLLEGAPTHAKPKRGFVLPDAAGSSVKLGATAGGVTIVHFFATSCDACREELPALRRFADRLAGKRVTVLAISVGDPVRKVVLEEPPGHLQLDDPKVVAVRKMLFGSWETNWLAYNTAHDVVLPGSGGLKIGYLMYPEAMTGSAQLDSLDPATFKYAITAKEVAV